MKLATIYRLTSFMAAILLSAMAAAGKYETEWWHRHGHSGGGVTTVGKPGDSRNVSRTVVLEMNDDMRFTPSTIAVKRGETIRFIVKNSGKVKHEMVLGAESQLKELYHTRMQTSVLKSASPSGITVEAGRTGEIIWQFTKLGTVSFACLLAGHDDAGMRGTVTVR